MPLRDVSVPTVTFDDESVRNVGTWITRLGIARVWIDILRDRARVMKRGVGITALLLGEWVLCFPMFFFVQVQPTSFFGFYFSWSPAPPNCENEGRRAACSDGAREPPWHFVLLCHDSPSAVRVIGSPTLVFRLRLFVFDEDGCSRPA